MKKEGEYEHYHHLHLSGFDHTLIKIIKDYDPENISI